MSKTNTMPVTPGYDWKFRSVGGEVRVDITSGEDIANLDNLDQKLWTVLSCPTNGLEFDAKTLALLDTDADGKVRVDEVVEAAKWITSVIKDKDLILKGDSVLPLDQINDEALLNSAKQILSNLGLEKDSISIEDSSDSVAIFANTRFNGDGVITPASTDDEKLAGTIGTIISTVGSVTDRSGKDGVNEDLVGAFYANLADYAAWQDAFEADKAAILPYGDNTAAALAACDALKDKIADYFMRCKLIAFNEDCTGAVDVSAERIGAISDKDLSTCGDEIASYPLARPAKDQILRFNGINPAWQAAFANLKAQVLDVDFAGADGIDEAQWQGILAKFAAFTAWNGAKKGACVEALGTDAVKALLGDGSREALLALIAEDKALEAEATSIDTVDKMLHLYRYFYDYLRNYVILTDFYDKDKKAVFEVGKLYIDQRCCDLCIKVEDMGKHADMAALSGMFLIYCTCTSKVRAASMNIVAVMTDGGVRNLRPGKNAIFYDRGGEDWDAVVTKVVDNPISVKQAFWSPYRKFWNFCVDKINKNASEKENAVTANLQAKADGGVGAATEKKPAFDIGKFAGIFAAIGLALGYVGAFLTKLVSGAATHPLGFILGIVIILLCISGPSCFIAWSKLRKRDLGPVLNANGWAINSVVKVSIPFGATLTSVAKYPKIELVDPEARKKNRAKRAKRTIWIIVAAILILGGLYLANCFKGIGLKSPLAKDEAPAVEQVIPEAEAAEAAAEPAAEAPAETPAE